MSQITDSNLHISNSSPNDWADDATRTQFVIKSMLAKVRTSLPVEVVSVTNSGGVSPIGYVDIHPIVSQLDGTGNAIPHGVIYNVPYLRIQGGTNAIIIDPQVGDIGIASFCDRDITSAKYAKKDAPPGSLRRHDMSDAIYHHSIIGAAPTQYVQFNSSGITIHSPVAVNITAPIVNVNATTSANVTAPSISLGASGQSLLAFVTSAFTELFNGHTHNETGTVTGAPNQTMNAGHITTTVKGG